MYDLIGDIHGHAAELEELLRRMGYARRAGAWRHPERQAVFVGDFLDRGPEIRETLRLVRDMLESGSARAVLGNHEWNAFAFHSPDPDLPGEFLRRHVDRNVQQVAATLAQVPAAELASHLDFLRALPIALELRSPGGAGDLRVVHACWDEVAFEVIEEALARHRGLTDPFLIEGSNPQSLLFAALEIVLKGKEIALPAGDSLVDKDGNVRHLARVRWYAPTVGQSISSYTLPHFPHLVAGAASGQGRRRGTPLSGGRAAGLLRPLLARRPGAGSPGAERLLPRLLGRRRWLPVWLSLRRRTERHVRDRPEPPAKRNTF